MRAAEHDHPKLINQIVSLERRTARSGRDSIDHPQVSGAHDDLANCCAGAASLLLAKSSYNLAALGGTEDTTDPVTVAAHRRRRAAAEYHASLLQQFGQPVAPSNFN
jgi:hypothetical protein